MKPIRAVSALIPGVFLLLLGLGNIVVGTYKGNEYEEVLLELDRASGTESTDVLINASPLRRVQLSRQARERIYQRQRHAQARRDFYRLVVAGGNVFVLLSTLCLFTAAILRILEQRRRVTAGAVEGL